MHDSLGEVLVDVGLNELLKREANLIVFPLAVGCPLLWQVLDGISE